MAVITSTEIAGSELFSRGKVRDTWFAPRLPTGGGYPLLMVTTDRISAFDVIMEDGVPDLGKVRNMLSLYWFKRTGKICPNHLISDDQQLCASVVGKEDAEKNDLPGRVVLVHRAEVFPVECIVRGYLAGSAWKDYKASGTICGIKLPAGLREADKLSRPIFTPSTKAKTGHDVNITFDDMVDMIGGPAAELLRDISLNLYEEARHWATICGIIIADTKFEFGLYDNKIILVDELLTPDSSRFWDIETYKPGQPQPSFDKQPLRDWLEKSGWNKQPPPPALPDEVIEGLRQRYIEAYETLVGNDWPPKF